MGVNRKLSKSTNSKELNRHIKSNSNVKTDKHAGKHRDPSDGTVDRADSNNKAGGLFKHLSVFARSSKRK